MVLLPSCNGVSMAFHWAPEGLLQAISTTLLWDFHGASMKNSMGFPWHLLTHDASMVLPWEGRLGATIRLLWDFHVTFVAV